MLTRQEIIRHVEASARLEGVELDEDTRQLLKQWANYELTAEHLDKWLLVQKAIAILDKVPAVPPAPGDDLDDPDEVLRVRAVQMKFKQALEAVVKATPLGIFAGIEDEEELLRQAAKIVDDCRNRGEE